MMKEKTAALLDGKALAQTILLELKKKVGELASPPGLAAVLVGDDPASRRFVDNKKKACEKVGIMFHEYRCETDCTEADIISAVNWLNNDPGINGIIIQLPLPKQFDTQKIINALNPDKDVDGFHPNNTTGLTPPLIGAIKAALLATQQNLKNKTAVVVSKNPIFSDQLVSAMRADDLQTQTIIPDDKNFDEKVKAADVVVSIVGKKHLITKEMIKADAVVIDVATILGSDKTWSGDVDPDVKTVASFLTPVPGGVGPLTVAMLLTNTYQLALKQTH